MRISKSEKKRQAKRVEKLAQELAKLNPALATELPCPQRFIEEVQLAQKLSAGARKRQIKYLARELRAMDTGPILDFLAQRKGLSLREKERFHRLEQLRDAIITDAIEAQQRAEEEDLPFEEDWPSPALTEAVKHYPDLDTAAVRTAAHRFAQSRKPVHRREVFRLLSGAAELAQRSPQADHKEE